MALDSLSTDPALPVVQAGAGEVLDREVVRRLIDEHYAFIWRLLARLGVQSAEVDDATQQVFMVLMTRDRSSIRAGSERSFLFGVALRVAQEYRRRGRKQQHEIQSDVDFESLTHPGLDLEALTDQQRARELLDRIVAGIPEELRMVFILFEVEGLPAVEVAALLGVPAGTVASRLRRARQHFREAIGKLNLPGTLRGLR